MPAKDYAAATGVRARSDLSANPTPPAPRLSRAELVQIASHLSGQNKHARRFGKGTIGLRVDLSDRLVEVLLEIVNAELIP